MTMHRPDETPAERAHPGPVDLRARPGVAVSMVEEFPKLAARGRDHLGVRVSSARAVGQFVVKAGVGRAPPTFRRAVPRAARARHRPVPHRTPCPRGRVTPRRHWAATARQPTAPGGTPAVNGHVPEVSTLSIPGFDSLSASQVVQRLDGLNRAELVSVRAYEASTRGRRTILSRVDQLLDERS